MLYFCFAFWGNAHIEPSHLEEVQCQGRTLFRTHKNAPFQCVVDTGNDNFNDAAWFANALALEVPRNMSPEIRQAKQKSWGNYQITGFALINSGDHQVGLSVEYNSLRVYLHGVMNIFDVTKPMLEKFYRDYHEKDTAKFKPVDQKQKALNLYQQIEHLEQTLLENKTELDQIYSWRYVDDQYENKTEEEKQVCDSAYAEYGREVDRKIYLIGLLDQRFSHINTEQISTKQKKDIFRWFFKGENYVNCPVNLYGLSNEDKLIFFDMINDDSVTDVVFWFNTNNDNTANNITAPCEYQDSISGALGQAIDEQIINLLKEKRNLRKIVFTGLYPIFIELDHLKDWASKGITLDNVFALQYDRNSWQAFWETMIEKKIYVSCWPAPEGNNQVPAVPAEESQNCPPTLDSSEETLGNTFWGTPDSKGSRAPAGIADQVPPPTVQHETIPEEPVQPSHQDNLVTEEDLKVVNAGSECVARLNRSELYAEKLSNSNLSEEQVLIVEKILKDPRFSGVSDLRLNQTHSNYKRIRKALNGKLEKINHVTFISTPAPHNYREKNLDDDAINIIKNCKSSLTLDGYQIDDAAMFKLSAALSHIKGDNFRLTMFPHSLKHEGLKCLFKFLRKHKKGVHNIFGAKFLIDGVIQTSGNSEKLVLDWTESVKQMEGCKELIAAVFAEETRPVKISFKKAELHLTANMKPVLEALKKIPTLEEVDFSENGIGDAVYNLIRDNFWGQGYFKNLKKIIVKKNAQGVCSGFGDL